MEDLFHVERLVGYEDQIHLFLQQPIQENVVTTIGTRTDQMKIVNYQQKVLIRILIECLKVEDSPCLGFFEDVGLEV